MKEKRFKQCIQVPEKITSGVFNLPCVISARKDRLFGIIYFLAGDTKTELFRWGDSIYAKPTDWICEDYDGNFYLLGDKEYEENKKTS